jgi:hypothetical protein
LVRRGLVEGQHLETAGEALLKMGEQWLGVARTAEWQDAFLPSD